MITFYLSYLIGYIAELMFQNPANIAARQLESVYFQKDRDTIEKRSGRWLKDLLARARPQGSI